jgi:SUMO ligase MMS21 Smc5/6 complex component
MKYGFKIPAQFLCSMTNQLMKVPIVSRCGHMFDYSAIERFKESNSTSVSPSLSEEALHYLNFSSILL